MPSDGSHPALALLAEWLPCAVLIAGAAGSLVHANEAARALLGEGESLTTRFRAIAHAIGIDEATRSARGSVTLGSGEDALELRYEVHAAGGERVVLLADRRSVGEGERPLLLANEAMLLPLAVSQLVHDVRGRSNEIRMSLAATGALLGRSDDESRTLAADRLQTADASCAALSEFVGEWRSTVLGAPRDEPVDLHAILAALPHLLMHPSLVRNVGCEIEAGAPGRWTRGDARRLRAAIVGVAVFLVEHGEENGRFELELGERGGEHVVTMRVGALEEGTPPLDAMLMLSPPPDIVSIPLRAARLVVEAHRGSVAVLPAPSVGVLLLLPASTAPAA